MGKFLYSSGDSGMMEIARPVLLPLFTGLPWKLELDMVFFSNILVFISSIFMVYLVYLLGKEVFNKKTALISIILLIFTPLFFTHSSRTLTDIPTTVFSLLAIYFYMKKKSLFLVGIFSSIAFLFRFPSGLILVVISLMIFIEFLRKKGSKSRTIKKYAVKYTHLFLSFIIPIIPYLIFNYFMYRNDTCCLHHALFRPWILSFWSQSNLAGSVLTGTISSSLFNIFYYPINFISQNYFFIFIIFGLYFYFRKKLYKNDTYNILFVSLIIYLLYFSYILNKELRYGLVFLPFFIIFSSYGITEFFERLKKINYKNAFLIFVSVIISFQIVNFFSHNYYAENYNYEFYSNLKGVFLENNINGNIITNNPIPSVYVENKFEGYFYSDELLFQKFVNEPFEAVVYAPHTVWCAENDIECKEKKNTIFNSLKQNYNLIFFMNNNIEDFYIFSKDLSIPSLNKDVLGKKTLNKARVVFRMDSAAAVYREDGENNIWRFEDFKRINEILDTVTWSIIPKDIEEMNEVHKNYLVEYAKNNDVSIAQNGYNHEDTGKGSEFNGLPYSRQKTRISMGKNILENEFGEKISVFVPPFSSVDKNTKMVLEELNFTIYSSVPGDETSFEDSSIKRYDQTISFVDDLSTMKNKDLETLKKEFDTFILYKKDIIITLHHFNFEDEDFETLKNFLEYIKTKNVDILSLQKLDELKS
ncbi:glycosyltransferase family 39 protein [Candidatus Woesearchaeota archaeon]|nr:glycosyltransferase family 39 protein [Candidatus Woesearchaeota archaeon]